MIVTIFYQIKLSPPPGVVHFVFFSFSLEEKEKMSQNFVPLFDKQGTQPGNNYVGRGISGLSRGGGGSSVGGGAGVQPVKIISNAPDEDFQTGRTKPPIITTELPQSVNILIDSNDRITPNIQINPYDFRCSLNSNLYRSRFFRVQKVLLPKIPNITQNNNTFHFYDGADVLNVVTIATGYYNATTFANALTLGMGVNYVCVYNPLKKTFDITNIAPANFFISPNCSFIQKGNNFAPFETQDELAGATVAGNGRLTWSSGIAGMLYTKHVLLASESFNTFAFAISKTSDIAINEDVIAIVDVANQYNESDWAPGSQFAGIYTAIYTPDAPFISLRNPQRNLNPQVDILVLDEYGLNLNEAYDYGGPSHVGYGANRTGFSFWMEVTF